VIKLFKKYASRTFQWFFQISKSNWVCEKDEPQNIHFDYHWNTLAFRGRLMSLLAPARRLKPCPWKASACSGNQRFLTHIRIVRLYIQA